MATATHGRKRSNQHHNWKVNDDSLKTLPDFFQLDNSSIFVTGSCASTISRRISDFLRRISAVAVFYDNIALAEATTDDEVQFTIRLFRGRIPYSHGIILEVKRSSGSSILFQEHCRCIFDVALDAGQEQSENYDGNMIPSLTKHIKPLSVEHNAIDDTITDTIHQAIPATLVTIYEMTESCNLDVITLALERLSFLTNTNEVNVDDAVLVSEAIIFGHRDYFLMVPRKLYEIIGNITTDFCLEITSEDNHTNWFEVKIKKDLMRLSLLVIGNSLTNISQHARRNIMLNEYPWLGEYLIHPLLTLLRHAEVDPRLASLAVRCISALCCMSPEAVIKAQELNVIPALMTAIEFGNDAYTSLAREADFALFALGNL